MHGPDENDCLIMGCPRGAGLGLYCPEHDPKREPERQKGDESPTE